MSSTMIASLTSSVPPEVLSFFQEKWTLLAALLCFYPLIRVILSYGHRHPLLPPGPPTLPIIGNALVFPTAYSHRKFSEWANQYGEVFSLQVFHKTIIVLNSATMVKEVFDKRSVTNINRPYSAIVEMMTSDNMNMGLSAIADDTWRTMRRAANQLLSRTTLKRYNKLQHAELVQMLVDMARDPDQWHGHIQREVTSYTLALIYGKRAPITNSAEVKEILYEHHRFNTAVDIATAPPVDLFPFLKHVPSYFAAWKRNAREVRGLREALFERLAREVETRMKAGLGNGSFVEAAFQNAEAWGMKNRSYVEHLGGTLLEGAVTTGPATVYLILCAAAFPDKQAKVAEELDRVIGNQRVPTIDDLENLPYTWAFSQECTRFMPVGNLGLPHAMVEDVVIDGYLYPKDAVILQNTYHIFHDPQYFDRPFEFLPERFLNNHYGVKPGIEDDPGRRDNMLFGGGRRACPGAFLARTHLDVFTAYIFWALQIKPRLDPTTGKEVPPDLTRYDPGLTAVPWPFECRITPRSKERMEVLQQEFSHVAEFLKPYEQELTQEERDYNAKYRDI